VVGCEGVWCISLTGGAGPSAGGLPVFVVPVRPVICQPTIPFVPLGSAPIFLMLDEL